MKISVSQVEEALKKFRTNRLDEEWFFCDDPDFLIYGTGSAQTVYLRLLICARNYAALKPKEVYKYNFDNALDYIKRGKINKEDYREVSNYWLSVKNLYHLHKKIDVKEKKVFWKDFGEFQTNFYRNKQYGEMYKVREKGPQQFLQNTWVNASEERLIDDYLVRRSCKFLMYDAIRKNISISYALDDLDLSIIAKLSNPSLFGRRPTTYEELRYEETINLVKESKVPICTSELREIFRYWDYFCNHVTFYENFKVCDPPWLTSNQDISKEWTLYAIWRMFKLGEKVREDIGDNMCIDFDQQNYSSVIWRYHTELQPHRFSGGEEINSIISTSETKRV